jgi:hypothetical protein
VELEELGQAQAGGGLDLGVDLDEARAEPGRQGRPDGRLAGAAHAEERDRRTAALGGQAGQELGRRGAQGRGHRREPRQRDVAGAGLELGQEPLAQPRRGGQLAPRLPELLAGGPDAGPDHGEQRVGHRSRNILHRQPTGKH